MITTSRRNTAIRPTGWIHVATVAETLSRRAPESEIATNAAEHGWMLFTTDVDFLADEVPHGLLVYSQIEDPAPGDVIAAIEAIDEADDDPDDITEFVPGGWA